MKYYLTPTQFELLGILIGKKISLRQLQSMPTNYYRDDNSILINDLIILSYYGLIKHTIFSKKFKTTIRGNYVFYNPLELTLIK